MSQVTLSIIKKKGDYTKWLTEIKRAWWNCMEQFKSLDSKAIHVTY